MVRKLTIIWISVVAVWLLMVQVDALSWYQPRFWVWAGAYLVDTQVVNDWYTTWVLPDRTAMSEGALNDYNYATMLAQYWESIWLPEAVPYWEQAVEQYESLLDQELNTYAMHNKLLLEQLLEQAQQQAEEQNQWESWEEWSEGQGDQEEWSQPSWEEWSQQWEQNGEPSWEEQWSQGEAAEESGLSEQQLQQLQDYQKQLKQQQFQNQQYFGKQQQDQPQSVFEQFFGDPQFRQWATWVEKDW